MILLPVQHLELSANKGTKKVCETADMVMVLPTENTKDTKIRIPMKLDDKSQQIKQITQIIKSVKSVQSDVKKNNRRHKRAQKEIRAIRVIRWQQKEIRC